jgi:hypothetical protein
MLLVRIVGVNETSRRGRSWAYGLTEDVIIVRRRLRALEKAVSAAAVSGERRCGRRRVVRYFRSGAMSNSTGQEWIVIRRAWSSASADYKRPALELRGRHGASDAARHVQRPYRDLCRGRVATARCRP